MKRLIARLARRRSLERCPAPEVVWLKPTPSEWDMPRNAEEQQLLNNCNIFMVHFDCRSGSGNNSVWFFRSSSALKTGLLPLCFFGLQSDLRQQASNG